MFQIKVICTTANTGSNASAGSSPAFGLRHICLLSRFLQTKAKMRANGKRRLAGVR